MTGGVPHRRTRALAALATLAGGLAGGAALSRAGALARPGGGPAAGRARGAPGGIGRARSRAGERVSDELRLGGGEVMGARRRAAALSLLAAGSMGVVALYQLGILRHLPEPPLRIFDADAVDAAGEAYGRLRTPDAVLGLASYAGTAVLAAAGGADRARRHPWLPIALALKLASDAAGAGVLTLEQATRHRAFCAWCLLAAVSSMAALPQALPELREVLAG